MWCSGVLHPLKNCSKCSYICYYVVFHGSRDWSLSVCIFILLFSFKFDLKHVYMTKRHRLDVWKRLELSLIVISIPPALSQEIKQNITNYLDDLKTVEELWNLWKTQTWYLFMYKNFEKRAYNSITPGPGLTKKSWTSTLHRDHLQQVSLGWLVNRGKRLRQDLYGCVRISKQGAFF